MADLSRRTFLQIAAAIAATGCSDDPGSDPIVGDARPQPGDGDGAAPLPGDSLPDGAAPDGGPPPPTTVPGIDLDALPAAATKDFPYGVMAGDATHTNAMLWTRYAGAAPLFIQLEAENAPKGEAVLSRAVAAAEKAEGGFVHVDAAGLTPGARYRYAFFVTDDADDKKPVARGPFGYVRAALAPGALEVVTFAGTSCTHQTQGAPYPLLADAAKRKVDFFIHGGDHVYCDAGTDAATLAQYRAKYAEAWAASGMRALHGSTGMVLTWDDHEILNNWDPETFPAARLDAARRAYFEHRASRRDPASPNRLWKSLVWGDTLEILVLDVRSERKPSTRAAANAQFISPAQMKWLKDRLKKSTAVFKFVITSVPITNFPPATVSEIDKWEGYPAQREEILDFIVDQKLTGVWWLSGDLHFGSIGGIGTSGPRLQMREVLMGPGGTNATLPTLPAAQFEKVIGEKNYTLFRADPVKKELTIEYIGASGSLFKKTYPA